MSDGQTETNEMIAAQNAICVRLERGEAVKFQDDSGQWHVGAVLNVPDYGFPYPATAICSMAACRLVHTATGIYVVSPDALEQYPPRCEACEGSGTMISYAPSMTPDILCPACRGSGRQA